LAQAIEVGARPCEILFEGAAVQHPCERIGERCRPQPSQLHSCDRDDRSLDDRAEEPNQLEPFLFRELRDHHLVERLAQTGEPGARHLRRTRDHRDLLDDLLHGVVERPLERLRMVERIDDRVDELVADQRPIISWKGGILAAQLEPPVLQTKSPSAGEFGNGVHRHQYVIPRPAVAESRTASRRRPSAVRQISMAKSNRSTRVAYATSSGCTWSPPRASVRAASSDAATSCAVASA